MRSLLIASALVLGMPSVVLAAQTTGQAAKPMKETQGNWAGGNPGNATSKCPAKHYMVGIEVQGSPGSTKYCIGCVQRVRVICQELQ